MDGTARLDAAGHFVYDFIAPVHVTYARMHIAGLVSEVARAGPCGRDSGHRGRWLRPHGTDARVRTSLPLCW